MDIESLAVSAVKNRVSRTDRLAPYINDKDKEPMWDGHIYVYKDDSKTNKSFKDKIPIQVKGKVVSKIEKEDKIRYSVETVCLNKYRDNGGIMYFVVYITRKDRKTTIFYAYLLPFKINKLLDKKGKQQSISIKLKELPDGDKEFEGIADWFIDNSKRQLNERSGKNTNIEVLQKNFKKDLVLHIKYSFLENEGYTYAENKDLNLTFPVEHIENIIKLMLCRDDYRISANGNSYSYRAIVSRDVTHKGESIVDIGKSFKFIINEKTKEGFFKINIKGYLEDRIKAHKFLLDVIDDDGKMYFNGGEQPLKLPKKSLSKLNRNDYEKCLKNLELLKKALDDLNVKKPLDFDKVTKEQHKDIDMLIYYFSHKEEGIKINGEPTDMETITIGNIKIMLFFIKMQDGRYKIYDFFRNNKINMYVDYKEKRYLTTRFGVLKADEYLNVANIDFEIIEKEFKSYTNVGNYGVVNDSCIEMIRAYDKDNKRVNILDMAIKLYDWLIREDGDNLMYVINKFQCYKRKRELLDEEVKWLEKQLLNKEISEASIASIYTLLGNKESVKMHIEKFNEEDKQSFYGTPIESLYNKL